MGRSAPYLLVIPLAILMFSSELLARFELSANVGKRWMDTKNQPYLSIDSFIGSADVDYPINEQFSLYSGPSLVVDHYESKDDCGVRNCLSGGQFKLGLDTGMHWEFPSVSLFFQVRWLLFARGRERSWGRTNAAYFIRGVDVFEDGVENGEILFHTRGFDLGSGVNIPLSESVSCALSFEVAMEESRVVEGLKEIENSRGYFMRKSESLKSDWRNFKSSGLYIGLQYKF